MNRPTTQNGSPSLPHDLISKIEAYVKDYMDKYDASHDYNHIQRVLALSQTILSTERNMHPEATHDEAIVTLGALLHDVGDKKYLRPGQDATTLARDVLLASGAPEALAAAVQRLVLHVSFSTEKKDPRAVLDALAQIPELAIVQDADRLDAIGAVGIARCFAFTGAMSKDPRGLDGAVEHFKEKLELLEGMMKTETGRRMARVRTERILEFRGWWESETQGLT